MERRIDEVAGEGALGGKLELGQGKEGADNGAKQGSRSRRLKCHRRPLGRSLELGEYR